MRAAAVEVPNLAEAPAPTTAAGMTAALAADATWTDDTGSSSLEASPSPAAGDAAEDDEPAPAVVEAPQPLPAPIAGAGTIVEHMEEAALSETLRRSVLTWLGHIESAATPAEAWAIADKDGWKLLLKKVDDYPKVKGALTAALKRKTEASRDE